MRLNYQFENIQISPPNRIGENMIQDARQAIIQGTMKVALKKLPLRVSVCAKESAEKTYFKKTNNEEWVNKGTVVEKSFLGRPGRYF